MLESFTVMLSAVLPDAALHLWFAVLCLVHMVQCQHSIVSLLYYRSASLFVGTGAYYGWSVGAITLALLPLMARTRVSFTIYKHKQILVGLFGVTCAVTWLLW